MAQQEIADAPGPAEGGHQPISPLRVGLLALQRPAAYFLPLAAALVSLHNIRGLLEATMVHLHRDPNAHVGLASQLVRNSHWLLSSLDLLVKAGTQLTGIAFGCAPGACVLTGHALCACWLSCRPSLLLHCAVR